LPKSRDVLNSAGLEFQFGKFEIKINKNISKNEKDIKLEDWLIEEKSEGKKEKPKWKPNPKLNKIEEEIENKENEKEEN